MFRHVQQRLWSLPVQKWFGASRKMRFKGMRSYVGSCPHFGRNSHFTKVWRPKQSHPASLYAADSRSPFSIAGIRWSYAISRLVFRCSNCWNSGIFAKFIHRLKFLASAFHYSSRCQTVQLFIRSQSENLSTDWFWFGWNSTRFQRNFTELFQLFHNWNGKLAA